MISYFQQKQYHVLTQFQYPSAVWQTDRYFHMASCNSDNVNTFNVVYKCTQTGQNKKSKTAPLTYAFWKASPGSHTLPLIRTATCGVWLSCCDTNHILLWCTCTGKKRRAVGMGSTLVDPNNRKKFVNWFWTTVTIAITSSCDVVVLRGYENFASIVVICGANKWF